MRSLPLALLTAAVALTACETASTTAPTPASGPSRDVVANDRVAFDTLSGSVDCNGDSVFGTAYLHTLVTRTVDAAGARHMNVQVQLTGVKAVGVPSGASYVGVQTTSDVYRYVPGQLLEETYRGQLTMIGQGSAPNVIGPYVGHLTIAPDGTIRNEIDPTFQFTCH